MFYIHWDYNKILNWIELYNIKLITVCFDCSFPKLKHIFLCINMYDSPATAQLKKIIQKNEFYYSSTPVVRDNRANRCYDNKNKKQMMATFMDSCSSSSCSCVQSRLLGPSDTYSTTSSQRSFPVNLMSGSSASSSTSSALQNWVLPPYTPIDPKHYVNMPPVYKPTVRFSWV